MDLGTKFRIDISFGTRMNNENVQYYVKFSVFFVKNLLKSLFNYLEFKLLQFSLFFLWYNQKVETCLPTLKSISQQVLKMKRPIYFSL